VQDHVGAVALCWTEPPRPAIPAANTSGSSESHAFSERDAHAGVKVRNMFDGPRLSAEAVSRPDGARRKGRRWKTRKRRCVSPARKRSSVMPEP